LEKTVPHLAVDGPGEWGHWEGVIGEEPEGPPPCGGRRRPPLDCCRFDAHPGRARTSPTSGARRASSRRRRGAPPFRRGVLQGLRRPWLGATLSPWRVAGRRSVPAHRRRASPVAAGVAREDPEAVHRLPQLRLQVLEAAAAAAADDHEDAVVAVALQ